MKKIITFIGFILLLSMTTNLYAETKNHLKEKPLIIKSHIVRMLLESDKTYRLELREYAAVYHADEKFSSCLQRSIKENKEASLVVSSQSLIVRECKVE